VYRLALFALFLPLCVQDCKIMATTRRVSAVVSSMEIQQSHSRTKLSYNPPELQPTQSIYFLNMHKKSRLQWPLCLKHKMSSPLKHWDQDLECHSRHGCLRVCVFVLSCVARGPRKADPTVQGVPPTVSLIISELILNGNRPEGLICRHI
jgi:hypothetical protein